MGRKKSFEERQEGGEEQGKMIERVEEKKEEES